MKVPHPDKPGKMISRQRLQQLRYEARGMCHRVCGRRARKGKLDCGVCARKAHDRYATDKPYKPHKPKSYWDQVDFTLSDQEISDAAGVTLTCVYHQRKKRGLPVLSVGRPSKPIPEDLDPTENVYTLAGRHGVSPPTVKKWLAQLVNH